MICRPAVCAASPACLILGLITKATTHAPHCISVTRGRVQIAIYCFSLQTYSISPSSSGLFSQNCAIECCLIELLLLAIRSVGRVCGHGAWVGPGRERGRPTHGAWVGPEREGGRPTHGAWAGPGKGGRLTHGAWVGPGRGSATARHLGGAGVACSKRQAC